MEPFTAFACFAGGVLLAALHNQVTNTECAPSRLSRQQPKKPEVHYHITVVQDRLLPDSLVTNDFDIPAIGRETVGRQPRPKSTYDGTFHENILCDRKHTPSDIPIQLPRGHECTGAADPVAARQKASSLLFQPTERNP